MFEGERTQIFWAGLFIVGLTVFGLFTTLWYIVAIYPSSWSYVTPLSFGCVVFLIIGFYMMKSGVKKEKLPPISK